MQLAKAQRGVSGIGWMLILGLIAFFTLIGLKVGPLYMEYGKIASSMDSVAEELGGRDGRITKAEIVSMIERRWEVNDVTSVTSKDIQVARKRGGMMEVSVAYQARAPLFSNLSIIADFSKSFEVGGGS